MAGVNRQLIELLESETAAKVPSTVAAVAEAARRHHGSGILAVLFYGSVLRDGDDRGRIVDLYLLAESYRAVHRKLVPQVFNRLLPPNVYYIEIEADGRKVRAKYAIVSLRDFERLTSARTFHPYFWARFAQPCAIGWTRDTSVRDRIIRALAAAAETFLAAASPLLPAETSPRDVWLRAFRESYRTELRSEPPERAAEIYNAQPNRYDAVARFVCFKAPTENVARRARTLWIGRRVVGKLLSVARLVKAGFTFQGGADYLAWKIERHSGVKVALTPWQRRHPILAAGFLFWRLYFKGAFR